MRRKLFLLMTVCTISIGLLAGCGSTSTDAPSSSSSSATTTEAPTEAPTEVATESPTETPTEVPTPEPTEAPHEHNYTAEVIAELTCETNGVTKYTCECGDTYEDEHVTTGHIFEVYTSNNDATYTADGTETAKCNNCDVTDTRVAEGSMLTYSYTDMDVTMYAQKTVNVRSLPSTDGEKLGGLSTNDEVKVTGQCTETSWYRIEYNGQVGYVSNNYLGNDKVVVQEQPANNNGGGSSLASHFGITLPCTTTANSRIYRDDSITYNFVWKTLDGNTGEGSMAGRLHDGTSVTIHELYGSESKCWAYITTADGLAGYIIFSDSYSQRVSSTGAYFSW